MATATRFPYADLQSMIAKDTDLTVATVDKVLDSLPVQMGIIFGQVGNWSIEIPKLGVWEERTVEGTLAKELGGTKYKKQAVSFRVAEALRLALQGKSKKLVLGEEQPLTDEEYNHEEDQLAA